MFRQRSQTDPLAPVPLEPSANTTTAYSDVMNDCILAAQFPLEDRPWKAAYGRPSNLGRCLPPGWFFGVRVALALFWLGISIWSMVDHVNNDMEPNPQFWIYLTNWTMLFELFYLVLVATLTGLALYGTDVEDGKGDETPHFVRIALAMQAVTYIASFFVFVLYWALVYDGGTLLALSYFTHGVNFLVALADFLLAGLPMRVAHIWAPLAYGLTYVIFSIIYDLAGGTAGADPYIYKVLDWSDTPGVASAYGLIVVFVAFPLFFFACLFGVYPQRAKCDCCAPEHPAYAAAATNEKQALQPA